MADGSGITASTIALGQTGFLYSWFLPKLSEVRRADPADPTMRGDVLLGQIAAGSVSMTVGLLLSFLTDSKLPVITTLFVAIVIAVVYQYAMGGKVFE